MKINWKQKLASRKFWALIIALVIAVMTAAGAPGESIERIAGIVGALSACVIYMLAESHVDAHRGKQG